MLLSVTAKSITMWAGLLLSYAAAHQAKVSPIGVEIIARPWREDVALALAQRLETELGGWGPPAL